MGEGTPEARSEALRAGFGVSAGAMAELTGLRNPCARLEDFREGLRVGVLDRDEKGNLVRKAGITGIVPTSGEVRRGDGTRIQSSPRPHCPL